MWAIIVMVLIAIAMVIHLNTSRINWSDEFSSLQRRRFVVMFRIEGVEQKDNGDYHINSFPVNWHDDLKTMLNYVIPAKAVEDSETGPPHVGDIFAQYDDGSQTWDMPTP